MVNQGSKINLWCFVLLLRKETFLVMISAQTELSIHLPNFKLEYVNFQENKENATNLHEMHAFS